MQDTGITIMQHTSNATLPVTPLLLWAVLGFLFGLFVIVSTIVIYHWHTYGYAPKATSRAIKIYVTGSVLITCSSIISIIMYATSV